MNDGNNSELVKDESFVSCWLIVNDNVERRVIPLRCLMTNDNGDYYFYDDYGNGSVHWSVINNRSEAFDRQCRDNVLWARERLEWALEHNAKEVPELELVIKTNGYTRLTGTLEKFRTFN